MIFDIKEFLEAVSNVLDVIETDIFGVPTNHSKRLACITSKLARVMGLSDEFQYDLAALSIMHDNGASLKILHDGLSGSSNAKRDIIESSRDHCRIGEKNISSFPFLTSPENVILYHHEKFDGSGFFGLRGSEIPLMSGLIRLADTLDLKFDLPNAVHHSAQQEEIKEFLKSHGGADFSCELAETALRVFSEDSVWADLTDDRLDTVLREEIPSYKREFGYQEIHGITKIFSHIIDAKSRFTMQHSSGLAELMGRMAQYYGIGGDEYWKLLIASDLHDLGKLGISNAILDKPGDLSKEEYDQVKKHPVTAKEALAKLQGFEDISEWIYNHHEKLNGEGYPRGLTARDIDFPSRLITCLDIYQALKEPRPYRRAMTHNETICIMRQMAADGLIDAGITEDVALVLAGKEPGRKES